MILQTLKMKTWMVLLIHYQVSKIALMGTKTLFLAANATQLVVLADITLGQMHLTIACFVWMEVQSMYNMVMAPATAWDVI